MKNLLRSRLLAALALAVLAATSVAQAVKPNRELPYVPPKRWALVVGAEKYENYAPLQFAADDARAFAKTLIESYRFDPSTVAVLADDGNGPAPTVANMRAKLDETLANPQLDKGDLFVFYFSGHGAGGGAGDFLLPTDTKREAFEQQGLPVKEVLDRIVKAGLKNVLIITDACRSGKENPFGAELQELGKKANIAVVLGCAPGTRSYEYPNLGRGIFTHFLLRALSQREPKEAETGALWASAIAKRVAQEVADRTERDYGQNLQRPAVWSEPTQDVLIGAFVPDSFGKDALKAFEEQAAKLNQKDYGKSLATFAEALYEQDRYTEAIQLLKTLDGIGEMTPAERYTFAMSLRFADRYTEAVKQFGELEKSTDSIYARLGVSSNPSRSMPVSKRIAAATSLWKETKDGTFAMLGLAVVQRLGEDAALASYLKEVLATDVLDEHQRRYAEATLAVAEGKTAEAIAAFREAAKGGDFQSAARLWLATLYRQTGDLAANEKLATEAIAATEVPRDRASWYYLRALTRGESGQREKMLEDVQLALKDGPDPDVLQALVRETGVEIFRFADDLIAAADKVPYSWRALMIKAFAESAKAPEDQRQAKAAERLQEALKYADDPISAFAAMVSLLDVLLEELHTKKAIPDQQYIMLLNAYSGFLADGMADMGQDPELWFTTVYMGLRTQRAVQLRAKMLSLLGGEIERNEIDPAVRASLLLVAIASGDADLVEKLAKGRFDAYDQVDVPWFLAVHYLGQSDDAKLKATVASAQQPSRELVPLAEAVRGYLDAVEGRKDQARTRASKIPTDDPGLLAIKVLVLKKLGEDVADLIPNATRVESWRYMPINLRVLREHLAGRVPDEDRVRLMLPVTAHAGNPLVSQLSFIAKPEVAAYAGDYKKRSIAWDDEMNQSLWDFAMSVDRLGVAKGKLGEIAFEGKVDAFGNLTGSATYQGRTWSVYSKLCPASQFAKVPEAAEFGVAFHLIDAKGVRIAAYLVDLPKQ